MSTCPNCRTRKPGKTEICYDCGLSEVEALQKKDDELTERIAGYICQILTEEVEESAELANRSHLFGVLAGINEAKRIINRRRDWPATIKQLLEIKK